VSADSGVVLGLDVGTTAVKVAAFDVDAHTGPLSPASREYPLHQPAPGWHVQDPPTILAAIDGAVADCVAGLDGTPVLAPPVSTAMHGLLGLDDDFSPSTPLLTWADSRATAEAALLRSEGLDKTLLHQTGTPVHPMSPLPKLCWFAHHDPDLLRRTRWWAGLKDYVLHHLTGRLVTELSSASGSGLLDLATRGWHPMALELAGISQSQLPEILPTSAVLTMTAGAADRLSLPGVAGGGGSGRRPARQPRHRGDPARRRRTLPGHQRCDSDGSARAQLRR
jgi:gluconokinase